LLDEPNPMHAPPPPPQPGYFYTDAFLRYDYGPMHPLRIGRLGMTHDLIGMVGLEQPSHPVKPASLADLELFHDRHYLEALQNVSNGGMHTGWGNYGLGPGDNPVFKGVFEWSALLAGASLSAGELVSKAGYPAAFNMAGGLHHALTARASGFCYVNDAAILIRRLLQYNLRVAYVDLDAHHGDGVQWAFYDDPRVLTISLHQHPATLFPNTGGYEEMGKAWGLGYAVNVPLWPDSDDEIYLRCFHEIVPPLIEAFKPDCLVTQLGADAFYADPLANLNLTTNGYGRVVKELRDMSPGLWIALGGGGYHVVNVARAWTLVWAIICGREDALPDRLPDEFRLKYKVPQDERHLLDPDIQLKGRHYERALEQAAKSVEHLHKNLFPLLEAKQP
jgi:acetoin utilization protein AcuC